MTGGMLHMAAQNRQVLAQNPHHTAAGLADVARWGKTVFEHGRPVYRPCPNLLIRTPSPFGQVNVVGVDLPDFSRIFSGLRNRRGLADWRNHNNYILRNPHRAGFVRPSVTKPKKGWAGCEQHKFLQHWRCARALRPVATQRVNRHFTARGRACLAHLSLTATRYLGPLQGLAPTCFIANKIPASADRLAAPNTRPFAGPIHITRDAAADHLVRGGALRFRPLQPKDTPCSPRS